MSSLTLVRHGQATAFQPAADRLTPLGETQARKLAGFWLKHGTAFDEVHSGTLTRQVQTERIVAHCYGEAGLPWPTVTQDAAWNEYDAHGVLASAGIEFDREDYRRFQLRFEAVMLEWLAGSAPADRVEPFLAFRGRVTGAIRRLMAGAPGRRVAIFTSGGPIGFTANYAIGGPDRSFLELNWRVRNASLTAFLFNQNRLSLDSFNSVTHLEEETLLTFR